MKGAQIKVVRVKIRRGGILEILLNKKRCHLLQRPTAGFPGVPHPFLVRPAAGWQSYDTQMLELTSQAVVPT